MTGLDWILLMVIGGAVTAATVVLYWRERAREVAERSAFETAAFDLVAIADDFYAAIADLAASMGTTAAALSAWLAAWPHVDTRPLRRSRRRRYW